MLPSVIESRETKQSPYQKGLQLPSITLGEPRYHATPLSLRKPSPLAPQDWGDGKAGASRHVPRKYFRSICQRSRLCVLLVGAPRKLGDSGVAFVLEVFVDTGS